MSVIDQANAAVEAGADPADVYKLLDGNPAQEEFGKQHIVKGDWVPAGAEFDEGEEQMVWPVLAALGSLFAGGGAAAAGAGAAGAGAAGAGAAGAGGAAGAAGALPSAFSGLGADVAAMGMPPGQAGPPNTLPTPGWQGGQDIGMGSPTGAEAEDPWYKGLMSGDIPGGGAQSQSMSSIKAPALHAVPAQQRRDRQKSEFMLHPALRSLMGG